VFIKVSLLSIHLITKITFIWLLVFMYSLSMSLQISCKAKNSFDKFCIDFVSGLHEHSQCASLHYSRWEKNTHTNHSCNSSCSREQFEYASSEFLFHQNSFDKCYTDAVWAFHEHIQCGVLDHYYEMKKSHTNHIENAFYTHEQL
jgi:hypothetical protein